MAELEHYLITPQGPKKLDLSRHYYFGRAEGNNFVVDDLRASRRHAEIYWDGSSFIIMDLGSSNGTYLNGDRINTKIMSDEDQIQIGFQVYTYRAVDDSTKVMESDKDKKDTRKMVTTEMPAVGEKLPDNDFNGMLNNMSVVEICQLVHLGHRSGMLMLRTVKKEKGIIYFDKGEIVSAECGSHSGEEAAYRMLAFETGAFSFRTQHPNPEHNISTRTDALLLEFARRRDEKIKE